MLAITTGDWIAFGLIIFFGLFAMATALVEWKMYRRPATTVTAGFWTAEPHSSAEYPRHLVVSAPIAFSPMGTSFQLLDAKCEVKGGTKRSAFRLASPPLREVHQGGQRFVFVFREEGEESAFPHPVKSAKVKISIRLADGSKFDESQDVKFGPRIIHAKGSYEPNRTPPEMARRASYGVRAWALRTWRSSFAVRIWNDLRHG